MEMQSLPRTPIGIKFTLTVIDVIHKIRNVHITHYYCFRFDLSIILYSNVASMR